MSELKHLRCDRCTDDEVFDPLQDVERYFRGGGWAHVQVGPNHFDLCPNCWKLIAEKENLVLGKGQEK